MLFNEGGDLGLFICLWFKIQVCFLFDRQHYLSVGVFLHRLVLGYSFIALLTTFHQLFLDRVLYFLQRNSLLFHILDALYQIIADKPETILILYHHFPHNFSYFPVLLQGTFPLQIQVAMSPVPILPFFPSTQVRHHP